MHPMSPCSSIGYDCTANMDCMDLDGHCQGKAVKPNHSPCYLHNDRDVFYSLNTQDINYACSIFFPVFCSGWVYADFIHTPLDYFAGNINTTHQIETNRVHILWDIHVPYGIQYIAIYMMEACDLYSGVTKGKIFHWFSDLEGQCI